MRRTDNNYFTVNYDAWNKEEGAGAVPCTLTSAIMNLPNICLNLNQIRLAPFLDMSRFLILAVLLISINSIDMKEVYIQTKFFI